MGLKALPPGVPFLFRLLLIVSTPPFAVYLAYRIASSHDVDLPLWAWIAAGLSAGPLLYTGRVWLKYYSFRRGAARRGAILPPDLAGHWIGNWDILTGILDAFVNGYPCRSSPPRVLTSSSWACSGYV